MPIVDIEGLGKVELDDEKPSASTLDLINKLKNDRLIKGTVSNIGEDKSLPRNSFGQIVAPEIPSMQRFAVAAAPNLESKVATLKKMYSDVRQDPLNADNFIVTDKKGNKFQVNDVSKTNFGDVIDLARPIAQIAGSSIGAIAGLPTGVGALATAGAGMAGGSELVERLGQLAGLEIERTPAEYLKDRALDVVIGASAEAAGPIVLKGLQRMVRGPLKMVEKTLDDGSVIKISDMAQRLENFATAGTKPTLTQVTENRLTDYIGQSVASFPEAAQQLKARAIQQQNDLGKAVVDIAGKLMGREGLPATGQEAGLALKKGIGIKGAEDMIPGAMDSSTGLYGANSFMSRFKGQRALNYAEVDKLIPGKTLMNPDNTISYLKKNVGDLNNLGALKNVIGDTKIESLLLAMEKNINDTKQSLIPYLPKGQTFDPTKVPNILPYDQLKTLRTEIGNKIADYAINEPSKKAFYKGLYGALSNDIKTGAQAVGDDALAALNKADAYHAKNMELLDNFLNPILDKVNVDNVTNSILKNAKDGPTQIAALRKALNDKEYNVVVSNILDNLGKKTTTDLIGKEGDLVETSLRTNYFNTNTFLNNWNKLSPEAKELLFNSTPQLKGVNKYIDNISLVANDIQKANPFGSVLSGETSRMVGQNRFLGAALGGVTGALSGGGLGAIGGGALGLAAFPLVGWGSAAAAKAFSNPAFLKWLSKGVDIAGNKGFNGVVEHLGKLPIIMAQSDPESRVFANQTFNITEKAANNALEQQKQKLQQPRQAQPQAATPTPSAPIAQNPTSPNVNMFAANTQAQTPSGQVQSPTGNFTNIPQDQLSKYSTLFGKVV